METAFRTSVFDHLGCWIRYKVCSLGLLKIINSISQIFWSLINVLRFIGAGNKLSKRKRILKEEIKIGT